VTKIVTPGLVKQTAFLEDYSRSGITSTLAWHLKWDYGIWSLSDVSKGLLFPVCAKLCIKMFTQLLFWVLPTPHSPGPWTDFHAKYVKRRDSALQCAFSGSENKNL